MEIEFLRRVNGLRKAKTIRGSAKWHRERVRKGTKWNCEPRRIITPRPSAGEGRTLWEIPSELILAIDCVRFDVKHGS
jgi:hypothetical protein